ncbi:3'-5' exonuclease [Phocaeicola barnesiae]|uniref:3'-5' exonuclease n=1 Tax=Phocaeicola barnesiae TaxID=376804 RepID=UPI00242FC6E2|nr:3'-5' exonuclease [Phocaeicola barnesiae]
MLDHFLGIFAANMQQHIDCLQNNSAVAELFRRAYADIYHDTLSRLYQRSFESPLLVDELEHLYDIFIQKEWIADNPKMQYIFSFLHYDVISPEKTPSLKEQLSAHLLDITTYREADLCDSSCIIVSTVHKAKGLKFENVIIFEATDGVYPFFDKKTPEEIRESARLFYATMTSERNACTSQTQNPPPEYPNGVTLTLSTRSQPHSSGT